MEGISKAIQRLNNGKVAGSDGIHPEFLTCAVLQSVFQLPSYLALICTWQSVRQCLVITLRAITNLTPETKSVEFQYREIESRCHFGCSFTSWNTQSPVARLWMSLTSTWSWPLSDCMDRNVLWKAMQSVGTPPFLLSYFRWSPHWHTLAGPCSWTHFNTFLTTSGVHQGCVLVHALFCRATDWILERCVSNFDIYPSHT